MNNETKKEECIKFEKMIMKFLKKELSLKDELFFQTHISNCENCRRKYVYMKNIYNNFGIIGAKYSTMCLNSRLKQNYSINEYTNFNNNLSAYIDNELEMNDNLMIKKILIKNKFAKMSFQKTNRLITLLKTDFETYSKRLFLNEFLRNIYFFMINLNIKS